MNFTDILHPNRIVHRLNADAPQALLTELVRNGLITGDTVPDLSSEDEERIVQVLQERERLGSTAIKDGLAIPHGKLPGLSHLVACMGIHQEGLSFGALDGGKSHVFVVLLSPDSPGGGHLKALARISRLFHDGTLHRRLMLCTDSEGMYQEMATEDARF